MLEELGMHAVEISFEGGPAPVLVVGPRLKDLVAAVGGEGSTVSKMAPDRSGTEISWDALQALDWIVRLCQDARALGLVEVCPRSVGYPYSAAPKTATRSCRASVLEYVEA